MIKQNSLYVPALRLKAGELLGLASLAPDVADRTLPRLIVPPRKERDKETQQTLMSLEDVPNAGQLLSRFWRGRRAILDSTYLVDDFGIKKMGIWLPKMFEVARREQIDAIPMASLDDLLGAQAAAFRSAVMIDMSPQLFIRIPSDQLVGPEALSLLSRALERVGLAPNDCSVIADFSDSDFSQPEIVADIIQGVLELLQDAGRWQQIVFQGTNFPEKNPAEPSSFELVPRNEWKAWKLAVKFDPNTAEHFVFGDYGADCAKMVFNGSGGRAIRHYRYTTEDAWLVQRGASTGCDADVMREVCRQIVSKKEFAGQSLSQADVYIYNTYIGREGPGNSTTWRAINTTHHITRVVNDIGAVKKIQFQRSPVEENATQETMDF
ncbi:MAG: beta family protein [Pseudomonadota bacterium]